MISDTVRLVNAVFYAYHGVRPEEDSLGARFEVDVSMDMNFEKAARQDKLEETVDYEMVYHLVKRIVTSQRCSLIERLAHLIAEKVLQQYEFVTCVEVAVRKPNPPIGGVSDYAEAICRKRRKHPSDSDKAFRS